MKVTKIGSWYEVRISKRNLDELVKLWEKYVEGESLPVLARKGENYMLTLLVEPDETHYPNVS